MEAHQMLCEFHNIIIMKTRDKTTNFLIALIFPLLNYFKKILFFMLSLLTRVI